ncbi:hypothetical protein DFJ74DRAFT_764228 [Hyaloraphidium curvatum]|nr:hypothetical protein DFJ74DRAFT_764228 [Hyaloraphidium curvatum]
MAAADAVAALLAELRTKDAEIARLRREGERHRFFFESAATAQAVVDWTPGSLYKARLAEGGSGASDAEDPEDDEFAVAEVNAAGLAEMGALLAAAVSPATPSTTPRASDSSKTGGYFDLPRQTSAGAALMTPGAAKRDLAAGGPVARRNPLYRVFREQRAQFFEAAKLATSGATVRFQAPNLPGAPEPPVRPDVVIRCVSAPGDDDGEVPRGTARFCITSTASRAEHDSARQLKAALDAAEAANRAKTTFVATISHELRTPLTAIIGFSRLLEDAEGLTEEEQSWALMIRNAGDSLTNIINDLIDVSKIEAGKMDVQLAPFHPREFLATVHAVHYSRARELGIDLRAEVLPPSADRPGSAEVPEMVVSDELRLAQVLHNLLTNAKKFTPAGGTISIAVQAFLRGEQQPAGTAPPIPGGRRRSSLALGPSDSPKSHTLRISVADTGIGLARDKLPLLFKEFSPGDPSYARQFGGTGLGLFISRRLVGLLGGRIGVDSEGEGLGCTFWFEVDYSPEDIFSVPIEEGPLSSHVRRVKRGKPRRARNTEGSASGERRKEQNGGGGNEVTRHASLLGNHPRRNKGADRYRDMDRANEQLFSLVPDGDGPVPPVADPGAQPRSILPSPADAPAIVAPTAEPLARKLPVQILVVEDNTVNQRLVVKLLSKEGYAEGEHVATARDGEEAVRMVLERRHRNPFDVVLMDVQMPVLDGLEATRMIRHELQPAEQPAIIALTANAMLDDRQNCFAAGMDAHVAKPVRARDLYAAIEKFGMMRRYAVMADVSALSLASDRSGRSWASSDGQGGPPGGGVPLV